MDKKYEEVNFFIGNTIEGAVKELMDYKEKGLLVCGDFNGVTLYSDTVTLDKAYKDITGKTKAEFDEKLQKMKDGYHKKQIEHKEKIPELSKVWMEKGREILSKDKWERWDEIVPVRLNDLYQGMELGQCLDIVDILNSHRTLEEAKDMIESQNHSGMSFSLVCSMVKEFCERGNDFVDYVR